MNLADGHWALIQDWQQFQRLVNDLLFHELQGCGMYPSNPRLGADGGWDGRVVGVIEGASVIHCC